MSVWTPAVWYVLCDLVDTAAAASFYAELEEARSATSEGPDVGGGPITDPRHHAGTLTGGDTR